MLLVDARLNTVDLRLATLTNAEMSNASMFHADLRDANLSKANLSNANLLSADLRGANLTGANLTGANLTDALIDTGSGNEQQGVAHTILDRVIWSNTTCPDGTMSDTHGDTCVGHLEPRS